MGVRTRAASNGSSTLGEPPSRVSACPFGDSTSGRGSCGSRRADDKLVSDRPKVQRAATCHATTARSSLAECFAQRNARIEPCRICSTPPDCANFRRQSLAGPPRRATPRRRAECPRQPHTSARCDRTRDEQQPRRQRSRRNRSKVRGRAPKSTPVRAADDLKPQP